jgi:hypothetical protein
VDEDISADGRHPGTSPTESYSCDRAGQQASAADEQREASPQVEVAFPCGSRLSADREISPGPAVQAAATRVEPEWQLD